MFIQQGKTNWKFLAIVIVLAVIVGGGIWWWQYRLPPEEVICKDQCGDGTCQEIVCLTIGCPCPETKENCPQDCEVDETADWQTYRNEEYGFEIRYPKDWKFSTTSPSYEGSPAFESLDFSISSSQIRGARIIVFIYQFKKDLYKDWQEQIKEEGLAPNLYTEVNINNKECLKITQEVKEYNPIGGIERYTESVSCANDDGTRIVTLLIELERANKEKYLAVFDQMLSTFRFIEEFFRVIQPESNQKITSPIQIKGEARLSEHEVLNEWISIEIIDENGHKLGWGKIPTEKGKIEGSFTQEVSYEQPTSEKGLIKIYEYVLEEGFVPTEGVLGSYVPKTLAEIPIVFGEELLTIPTNWKTYNNAEANFTFRYPSDWEVIDDYLYETPGGAKADERTIILRKIGEEGFADTIRINLRQDICPTRREISKWGHIDFISTCSTNPEVLDIYQKVLTSFRIVSE